MHHLIGKDILRFHCVYWPAMCMAAGIAPPHRISVHGYLLMGGEKMSKTAFNQISPADLVPTFGVDGYRYHFLRDQQFGPDGEFSYEAMVARYNSDLANNLGNLLARVSAVVQPSAAASAPPPGPTAPWRELAEEVYAEAAAAWDRVAPSEALERPGAWSGGQRRPGGGRALAGRTRPGGGRRPGRRPRGLAHRRRAGQPGAHPGAGGDLAPDRPGRHARGRPACLKRPSGAVTRGACRWSGAPRCSPGSPAERPQCGVTAIAMSPTPRRPRLPPRRVGMAPRSSRRRAEPGLPGWSAWARTRPSRRRPSPWLRPTKACGPPSACTPTTPPGAWTTVEPLLSAPRPSWWRIGECGLDYHYDFSPRPPQREAFAAQVALANSAWAGPGGAHP